MDKNLLMSAARKTLVFVRRSIVVIFLSILVLGIIGFTLKWSKLIFQPESVIMEYRSIVEDIFSILVVYELFELFRTLSPHRLMGIVYLCFPVRLFCPWITPMSSLKWYLFLSCFLFDYYGSDLVKRRTALQLNDVGIFRGDI
jgi:hypothetical protein